MKLRFFSKFLMLLSIQSYASVNVKISNKTSQALNVVSIDTNTSYDINPSLLSQVETNKFLLSRSQRLIINNNYAIQLVDTEKECSYLNAFNIRYSNGTIFEIFINNNKLESICSTKKHYLTIAKNIELIFANDQNSISTSDILIFRNAGWWANTNGYSVERNFLLNPIKMNLSSSQIDYFMINGIIL